MNYKNLGMWGLASVKVAVLLATLFLVSVWQGFANFATSTHWAWFLGGAIILSIYPLIQVFKQ